MTPEQVDRMRLGWSREDLARYSGVNVASVYLLERLGSSTESDDARIRDALARGLAAREAERGGQGGASSAADADADHNSPVKPRPSSLRPDC